MPPSALIGSAFAICLAFTIKVAGARMLGEKLRLQFVWYERAALNENATNLSQ